MPSHFLLILLIGSFSGLQPLYAEPLVKVLKTPLQQIGAALAPIMVAVPSGCFVMGSPDNEQNRSDNENSHRLCLKSFKLGKYEVTVEEFKHFVDATHYVTDAERGTEEKGCWSFDHTQEKHWNWWGWANWQLPVKDVALKPTQPVGCVSLHDVQAYIDWLDKETGHHYRLPTEAEWEYAVRAGTASARYWGNNPDIACRYANVADTKQIKTLSWSQAHACEDGRFFSAEVGTLHANAWGLHDMLGNVWEWTCSRYEEHYNGSEDACIKSKLDFDDLVVMRGGGWNADPPRVRAAYRNWSTAWARQANLGFRLVREH
jgi:formylglycine-generating enzyme required for sulfatase activity